MGRIPFYANEPFSPEFKTVWCKPGKDRNFGQNFSLWSKDSFVKKICPFLVKIRYFNSGLVRTEGWFNYNQTDDCHHVTAFVGDQYINFTKLENVTEWVSQSEHCIGCKFSLVRSLQTRIQKYYYYKWSVVTSDGNVLARSHDVAQHPGEELKIVCAVFN